MQFFRTAAWVVVAVILAIFWSYNRNVTVPINLFDQVIMEVKAPILILISFLLGVVPLWLYHRATRWHLNRRIESSEKALAALSQTPPATEPPADPPAPDAATPDRPGDLVAPTPFPAAQTDKSPSDKI